MRAPIPSDWQRVSTAARGGRVNSESVYLPSSARIDSCVAWLVGNDGLVLRTLSMRAEDGSQWT